MSRWEVNEVFDYPHLTISFGQLRVKLKQNSFVVPLFSIKIHWFTPRDCLKNKDNKWLILLNKIKQGTKIRIDRYIYINPDFSSFFSSDLHQMPKVCAPSPMAINFKFLFPFLNWLGGGASTLYHKNNNVILPTIFCLLHLTRCNKTASDQHPLPLLSFARN